MAQMLLEAPYPAGTLLGIAQRLIDARGSLDAPVTEGHLVTTADGRQWRIDPRRFDMGWVLACHLPGALLAAGLSLRRLPSLVGRSEEHTSELQSLMRISYAVFCLKKKKQQTKDKNDDTTHIT